MSSTTLASSNRSEEEQEATLLYEEDESNEIEKGERKTRSNLNMEVLTPDGKKSKNTAWIEEFLTRYYNNKNRVDNHEEEEEEKKKKIVELNKNQINSPPKKEKTKNIGGGVCLVEDFEIDRVQPPPPSQDLQAVLSDILSLKVRYKIVDDMEKEDKVSFFVVKVPPTNCEDRQLATLANVHEREIKFYTLVIPTIKAFCQEKGVPMSDVGLDLGLVHCYHANYDRPLEEMGVEGLVENLSKAESTIVLEDLRPQGFGKRHFSQPLTLHEVKSALGAIAKIHGYTWSISKLSGEPLNKLWPFYYKSEYAAMLYEALLEDGIPLLQKYLKELFEINKDFDAASLLGHLDTLIGGGGGGQNNLRMTLINLLTPAQEPSPTCLCHMDFWCDNIFFRHGAETKKTNDLDKSKPAEDDDDGDGLDCRILDWQMFSVGRPTHDIALLLFTALPAQIRKEQCTALLQIYLDVFQSVALKFNLTLPFDLTCLLEEYRQSQLWALLQIIASVDLALHDDGTSERLLDALQDLVLDELI